MSILLVSVLCIAGASVIGGATGFGTSLLATPFMLMAGVGLAETVVINLVVALVTRVGVVVQLREHMDRRRVATLGAAALPGAWLGVQTVSALPEQYLKPAAGVITVLCGVAMALPSRRTATAIPTWLTAVTGAIGGYFSTTTSLNGPPVVLLLGRARLAPLSFIADLAGYFVLTSIVSIALLWSETDVDVPDLLPALAACVVAGVLANQAGVAIARRLPTHVFRSAVIVLVVIAGIVTIISA